MCELKTSAAQIAVTAGENVHEFDREREYDTSVAFQGCTSALLSRLNLDQRSLPQLKKWSAQPFQRLSSQRSAAVV